MRSMSIVQWLVGNGELFIQTFIRVSRFRTRTMEQMRQDRPTSSTAIITGYGPILLKARAFYEETMSRICSIGWQLSVDR